MLGEGEVVSSRPIGCMHKLPIPRNNNKNKNKLSIDLCIHIEIICNNSNALPAYVSGALSFFFFFDNLIIDGGGI